MSNLTDFFPSGGGGGLTPKFQEFNASGNFYPSQALIDAGGYIEVFLVGGGGKPGGSDYGGCGGEVAIKKLNLTSIAACYVIIGNGATTSNGAGGNTFFDYSGQYLVAYGGEASSQYAWHTSSPSWGAKQYEGSAGNGVFGYGAGGKAAPGPGAGITTPKPNSGQGGTSSSVAGSGYCLIKWYE